MDEGEVGHDLSSASNLSTAGPSHPQHVTFCLPSVPAKPSNTMRSTCVTRVQPINLKQYWKVCSFVCSIVLIR
ncbi:unnamed protein product [Anisakis simplex]|uniref:Uncharacterized protein n=1 Tax=Anisakis simplex TaxID=6269 RepID=A0A0M3JLC1_ANISI|nr:unnamed protein product [Anisakis simplex]